MWYILIKYNLMISLDHVLGNDYRFTEKIEGTTK